jgi:hypothetical protein
VSGGASPKPRKCGAYTRRRGYTFENETRLLVIEHGLKCRRVPLSGAGEEKGDICITSTFGKVYRCELKRKKSLPDYIVKALGDHDALIMRADQQEPLAVVRLKDLLGLLQ